MKRRLGRLLESVNAGGRQAFVRLWSDDNFHLHYDPAVPAHEARGNDMQLRLQRFLTDRSHGGTIELLDRVPHGLRVRIELPEVSA